MLTRRIFAILCALIVPTQVFSASLFDEATPLDVELRGPRAALIKEKRRKTEFPFELSSGDRTISVTVRARGNSRLRLCALPPLNIAFGAGGVAETVFEGLEEIKLSTPCRKGGSAQADVLKEYLAYRIFNFVSEISFRVRLLRLTFVETGRGGDTAGETSAGFAIEPQSTLAKRIGGARVAAPGVVLSSLDRAQMARVYVFQYLIGNTDWSLVRGDGEDRCCHNGALFDRGGERYYVPYDFDLSGLVDAPYAYPDSSLPIRKVTTRLYRGFCLPRETLQGALADFRARRADIYGELDALSGLEEKERAKVRAFLDRFFAAAEDEAGLLDEFERRCL